MKDFKDKTSTESGTPLNRASMMAIQGFIAKETTFNDDGSITEVNADGDTLTTVFNSDGSIVETFGNAQTITRTTTFGDGVISEVIG